MKFYEALKALDEGKKVRVKTWHNKNAYVMQDFPHAIDNEGRPWETAHFFMGESNKQLEWEIYEKPPKPYTFMEVVKGLKEGKRFRRKYWNELLFGAPPFLSKEDFEATDWIEVK